MDKGYANKPAYVALWVHLLMMANHQDREFLWNGGIIKLKPGQFVTGRKALSEASGVSETTVERILNLFEVEQQIGQQKTTKYRLITILNWDKYQIVDNKRTTSGQQADTNKNDKKVKNVILEETSSSLLNLKDNKKDMGWNNPGDDYEEGVVDYDSDGSMKSNAPVSKKKYPNALQVYKVFLEVLGKLPANWKVNKTQLQCAENLFEERGLDKVRNALQFYKEHQEEEFCPQVSTPYDLDTKYTNLSQFKTKHEN